MTDMPKWMVRWQTQRSDGRSAYIVKTGVLGYGLAMFIAMTFFLAPPKVLDARSLLINAVIWAVGGAVFGLATWWISEWRYKRHVQRHVSDNQKHDAA